MDVDVVIGEEGTKKKARVTKQVQDVTWLVEFEVEDPEEPGEMGSFIVEEQCLIVTHVPEETESLDVAELEVPLGLRQVISDSYLGLFDLAENLRF